MQTGNCVYVYCFTLDFYEKIIFERDWCFLNQYINAYYITLETRGKCKYAFAKDFFECPVRDL